MAVISRGFAAKPFSNAWTALAAELAREPGWKLFADYCQAREHNLRKRAAEIIERFIEAAQPWPFEERKRFGLWLLSRSGSKLERGYFRVNARFGPNGPRLFAPQRAIEATLLPTFAEWAQLEPANAEPPFWLAHCGENPEARLREAIQLNRDHRPARTMLASIFLERIEYAQHELPIGYLGKPEDDLASLDEVQNWLSGGTDPEIDGRLQTMASTFQTRIKMWLQLREQLQGLDWDSRYTIWRKAVSQG